MPRWNLELVLAKESGDPLAFGVNFRCTIWKRRLITKMRAESKSYEFEPKK